MGVLEKDLDRIQVAIRGCIVDDTLAVSFASEVDRKRDKRYVGDGNCWRTVGR